MFGWFKSKQKETVPKETPKYEFCDVEYLPHRKKFFPRYKGKYLFYWSTRDYYSLEDSIEGCTWVREISEVKEIFDKFLELRGVETKIIKDF